MGDRNTGTVCVYPANAFLHAGKGGRVLNVREAPFGAKGDGATDDTQAFIRAYDYVANLVRRHGIHDTRASFIIYIPEGTYLVSDTILYSGKLVDYAAVRPGYEGMAGTRFIGQNRERTIDLEDGIKRGGKSGAGGHVPVRFAHGLEKPPRLPGVGTGIGPDGRRRAEEPSVLVKRHHAEAVPRNAAADNLPRVQTDAAEQLTGALRDRVPPIFRPLLMPAGPGIRGGVGDKRLGQANAVFIV